MATYTLPIDPLYGYGETNDRLIIDIINTPEFQRLRRIKQLSTASLTFPGAEHTRFSHSIGVYTVVTTMCDRLKKRGLTKEQALLARVAGLVHDIGHGAFSHTFETIFGTDHEAFTCEILTNPMTKIHHVLETYERGFSQKVADVINHTSDQTVVIDLISSQLDADRMDYLARDSYFTGASYGHFDRERIIKNMRIRNGRIVFRESALAAIESFVIGRSQMYLNVYFHETNRAAVVLLQKVLEYARDLYPTNPEVFKWTAPQLVPFLKGDYTLADYLALDDGVLMTAISNWVGLNDAVMSNLAYCFINRILPESVVYKNESDLEPLLAILEEDYQFDTRYETATNANFDVPYDVKRDDIDNPRTEITVMNKEGNLHEVSEISELIQSRTAKRYGDKRFFFPAELLTGSSEDHKRFKQALKALPKP